MGDKPPKGEKRKRVKRQVVPETLFRDATELPIPVDSSMVDILLRSHLELCTALRSAGRQIMRLRGDPEALAKIRQALNKAEALRSMWRTPERTETVVPVPSADATSEPAATEETRSNKPERKRPGRLSRPHAYRVLRFPSGDDMP